MSSAPRVSPQELIAEDRSVQKLMIMARQHRRAVRAGMGRIVDRIEEVMVRIAERDGVRLSIPSAARVNREFGADLSPEEFERRFGITKEMVNGTD